MDGEMITPVPKVPIAVERKGMTDKTKAVITIVLAFVLLFGVSLVATVIWMVASGVDILGMDEAELLATMPGWITFLPHIVLLAVFGAMYAKTIRDDAKRMTKKNWLFTAAMAVGVLALGIVVSIILGALGAEEVANQDAVEGAFGTAMILGAFGIMIAAPVWEEVVFRKALGDIVKNSVVFVILSAAVFGLMHWSGVATILYVLMGSMFAITYLKTGRNLAAAIVVHAVNNIVAAIFMLLAI